MLVDRHREQLHERLVLVAASVEKAYIAAVAPPGPSVADAAQRAVATRGEITGLSLGVHSDVMAYMARFRPVAADLRFATTVLGCSFDLREATDAIAGVQCILGRGACPGAWSATSRLTTLVHVVVCLMADAVVAWDVAASGAIRAAHQEVAMMRDHMHDQIASALVQPEADAGALIESDAIGCLLTRISSASASCVRRLAKAEVPSRIAPSAAHARSASPRHRAVANAQPG